MKKITVVLILVFVSSFVFHFNAVAANSAKASISGIIIDRVSKQPIEYANLILINPNDSSMVTGTISAIDGSFLIEDIEKGSYQLKVQFMGYQTSIIETIEIQSNKEQLNIGTIELEPASINLKETEVIANNDYIEFKIDKKVINVGEHISAEGGPIVDALHNVPSVQVDAGGNVSVRGSSSFTLLIDGRPSVMSPSDALNQIPSSSVEKIEVITNPNAKYDAEGTSGIINLIMKKQRLQGMSAQATLALATGDKYSGNVMVNQRTNKISSSLGATYSNKRKRTESKEDRESFSNDSTFYQNVDSDRDIYRRNYKINGGLNYDVSNNDLISINAEIGQWEFDRSIYTDLYKYDNFQSEKNRFKIEESYIVTNKYISGDVGYKHKFSKEGHELDASFFYSKIDNSSPNNVNEFEVGDQSGEQIGPNVFYNLLRKSDRDHSRFKLDYVNSLFNVIKLEAGYQNENKLSSNIYNYRMRSAVTDEWEIDESLSGQMDFSRMVNSFYTTLSSIVKGISVKAGLRMEYVDRSLQQKVSEQEFNYHQASFFPSLHLSKSLEKDQQISVSYSRRISRPNEWMLLSAPNSTGRNMLQIGNPELQPDFTDSYELGYSKRNDLLMLSSEIYIRNTRNVISPSIIQQNENYYQSYENLSQEFSSGVDLMSNINLTKWWSVNIAANIYYYKLAGTMKSGYVVDDATIAWNGRFRTTFIIREKTYFEFMTVYYGPSVLPQGKSKDFYYFDFFLRRNFFDRKFTAALRSHNTFDTGIYIEDTRGAGFNAHTWFKYEGPTFMITLTYRINNFKLSRTRNNVDMNFDSGLDL